MLTGPPSCGIARKWAAWDVTCPTWTDSDRLLRNSWIITQKSMRQKLPATSGCRVNIRKTWPPFKRGHRTSSTERPKAGRNRNWTRWKTGCMDSAPSASPTRDESWVLPAPLAGRRPQQMRKRRIWQPWSSRWICDAPRSRLEILSPQVCPTRQHSDGETAKSNDTG